MANKPSKYTSDFTLRICIYTLLYDIWWICIKDLHIHKIHLKLVKINVQTKVIGAKDRKSLIYTYVGSSKSGLCYEL